MRLLLVGLLFAAATLPGQIKVGMIGLDTSHVIAFTKVLNDPQHPDHVPGAKVVAAYKGGSPDLPSSRDRIDGFTKTLVEEWGVELVDDIPALCKKVDAILLESVDGRVHLEQVKPVFEAGLPVFIDKPLAAAWADVKEIARLSEKHSTPWWSASSLRYSPAVRETAIEGLTGAVTWGPAPIDATHDLDLSWYGIHPVELLFAVMGPGVGSVERSYTDGADVIVGHWKDGRMGVVRTIRDGKREYGVTAFGAKEVKVSTNSGANYSGLLGDAVEFFKTGKPPVDNAETVEIFAFLEAARISREEGGARVSLPR